MSVAESNPAKVTPKALTLYGFIALPVAFAGFPLYVLAPDFYATRHGLSLTLLGTLLLFIRLFDAFQDPFIGWTSDKFQGRFVPFVSVAGAVLCISIHALFNFVALSPALWFAVCMACAVSAYSILSILLGSQATLWTTNRDDQTRIASAREAFGLVGLVVAVTLPSVLAKRVEPEQVYLFYGATLAVLMLIGIAAFSRLPAIAPNSATQNVSPWAGLRAVSSETLRLLTVYGVSMLASSVPAVLVIFFVRDLLLAENLLGLFLLLYFLSGAVAMPFWGAVSARLGKHQAWALSNVLAVAGFAGAFYLGPHDVWAYGFVCLVSGLALGADLTLPPSILADQIHAGRNSAFAGIHYAFLAFIAKASLAVASATALPLLDIAGFKPQATNSESALAALASAYALIPCILKLTAAGLLYGFFIRSNAGGDYANSKNHGDNRSSHHA